MDVTAPIVIVYILYDIVIRVSRDGVFVKFVWLLLLPYIA